MIIELIKENILFYGPSALVLIGYIINFCVLIKKLKSIDYKTPLSKANDALSGVKAELKNINSNYKEIATRYSEILQDKVAMQHEYEKFKEHISGQVDTQNAVMTDIATKTADLDAQIHKKENVV